jgi:predicted nuclease of predicted toxin-antitoxin system
MNLLADENVERIVVTWLRAEGHDVRWAAEGLTSTDDEILVDIARGEHRIIVTYDLDFGHVAYRERIVCEGVVLLRCKGLNKWERLTWLQSWWPEIERQAVGHFIVVSNTRLRVRSLPTPNA